MPLLSTFIDFFIHLDQHLQTIIENHGVLAYVVLFLIIFCETGLVIAPFLPGDSLLFVAGTFAALGSLNIAALCALLFFAAILGDTVNYWIGNLVGPRIFRKENVRFLNKNYLEKSKGFYEKHGGKTVIFARFIPIMRTFAPFVAGIGKMNYGKFLFYNVAGGFAWVALFGLGGYFFGNIPGVKENLTIVIFGIIFVSMLPGIIRLILSRRNR